jgi:hypothetical protein
MTRGVIQGDENGANGTACDHALAAIFRVDRFSVTLTPDVPAYLARVGPTTPKQFRRPITDGGSSRLPSVHAIATSSIIASWPSVLAFVGHVPGPRSHPGRLEAPTAPPGRDSRPSHFNGGAPG